MTLVLQVFLFRDGQFLGTEMATGDRLEIGRDPTCDIVLQDDGASRKHALLFEAGGQVAVQDLGSANGTTLNGGADTGTGFGTVFQIDPAGTFTTLHDFGIDDGAALDEHPGAGFVTGRIEVGFAVLQLALRRVECCKHTLRQITFRCLVCMRHRVPHGVLRHEVCLHGVPFPYSAAGLRDVPRSGEVCDPSVPIDHGELTHGRIAICRHQCAQR